MKTLKIDWEGNPNSYMHVLIDTTNIAQLEEAKNNIKCQQIMFASASHEFRTPLNAILNIFDLIKGTQKAFVNQIMKLSQNNYEITKAVKKMSCKFDKFIKIGHNSSSLLLSLIEDILNLSKMDIGEFNITMSDFSIKELLDQVYDIYSNQ